jgi:hypothetical protein
VVTRIRSTQGSFQLPDSPPEPGISSIPDGEVALLFQAYSNTVRFCDMNTTPHTKESNVDNCLQLSLNNEDRSATSKPLWQWIIYHQGYRAGFLALNVPFKDLDLEKQDDLSPVAVSRMRFPAWRDGGSTAPSVLLHLRGSSGTNRNGS